MSRNMRLAAMLAALGGCGPGGDAPPDDSGKETDMIAQANQTAGAELVRPTGRMTLSSPSFPAAGPLPIRHTKYGDNISPALEWAGVPAGARSLALVVSDPDAIPVGGKEWLHWAVVDLPASAKGMPERGPVPAGARELVTDFGDAGYGGPQPPRGTGVHHYIFALYALSVEKLNVRADASLKEIRDAIRPVAVDQAIVIGTFDGGAKRGR